MTDTHQRFPSVKRSISVVIILLFLCTAPSWAIGVTGSKYMGSISPGGNDTYVMTISIGAGEPATDLIANVAGFGQTLNGVYIPLTAENDANPYSARSFITLDNSTVHLEPGTQQSVTATISLPQNVGAGGRYAIISIRSVPNANTNYETAVVVPVFITVTGTTPTETGSILQIKTGTLTAGQPITITTTFENTGNYHYYSTVNEVTVRDSTGAVVANSTTSPMAYAIIPGDTVQFVAQPDAKNLQPGTYNVDSKVLLNGQVLDENSTTLTVNSNYIPPVTESNITVSPGNPATLTSPDGRYSISFPQGAVLGDVVVTLSPYPMNQLSPAPAGAKLGATSFEMTGLAGLLNKDATVQVKYSADDLAAAGGDASLLKLSYWDAVQGQWVVLPTQVNTQDTTLTSTANQLGIWAVMVSSSTSAGSPASAPTKAPLPADLSTVALVITAIIVTGTAKMRK
jgi:hypothetical protein